MDKTLRTVDAFATAFAERVLRYRLWVIAGSVIVAFAIFVNAFSLQFSSNYRVFFSSDNPELTAFETFQATYTKNDNFLFVIEPDDGVVFTPETLAAVEELTAEAWQIPFSIQIGRASCRERV